MIEQAKKSVFHVKKLVPSIVTVITLLYSQMVFADSFMFVPKSISTQVSPNVTLTFDNSTSMSKAYTPDIITLDSKGKSNLNKYALRSPTVNKLYYNPDITYIPPLKADGTPFEQANFNNAKKNPFYGSATGIDLSTNFSPRWDEFEPFLIKFLNAETACDTLDVIIATDTNTKSNEPSYGDRVARECGSAAYYFAFNESDESCKQFYPFSSKDADKEKIDLPPNTCFTKVTIPDSQKQNFANWYQYYSTRLNAAKTAMSYAFAEKVFPSSIRVARQNFTTTDLSDSPILPFSGPTTSSKAQHVASFDFEERQHFYEWLFNQGDTGGSYALIPRTRLRQALYQAGMSYKELRNASKDPSKEHSISSNPASQCRSNYHLLVTDGQWYEPVTWASEESKIAKASMVRDEGNIKLPDGTDYIAADRKLYSGAYSTIDSSKNEFTLADVAFHFWSNDLLDVSNDVNKVITSATGKASDDYWNRHNNPATWQHMVNLIVSFGVAGSLTPSAETEEKLKEGGISWPHIHVSGTFDAAEKSETSQAKVDDLYHAAINSRGKYFAADSVSKLQVALKESVKYITDNLGSNTSVAINTSTISSGSIVFQAIYDGENGIGRLKALPLSDGSKSNNCNNNPIGTVCSPVWDASSKATTQTLNFVSNRNVVTFSGTEQKPIRFLNTALTDDVKSKLSSGFIDELSLLTAEQKAAKVTQLVEYLRGSDESPGFKNRHHSRLGPVVNSDPLYVSNAVKATGEQERFFPNDLEKTASNINKPYDKFICSGSLYANGAINSAPSCGNGIYTRDPVVYVNSNDGMLHAFRATTGENGGEEIFSYIPNMLLEKMAAAAKDGAPLTALADGALTNADVFFDDKWQSVLIGGLRSGGKGYYALNVTDPSAFAAPNLDENLVLWEFNADESDDDMGYSYSDAVIVKSNDTTATAGGSSTGRWVAIFGNGYDSANGKAVLFIVDIKTGSVIRKISTEVGGALIQNGLGTPALVFNDDGYTADYAYVGDLQGNLWKFDLRSSDPNDWGVVSKDSLLGKQPLFKARAGSTILSHPQSLTAPPLVSAHPSGYPGNMIYFGTGRYLTDNDHAIPPAAQFDSFYAIWDKDLCTNSVPCSSAPATENILTNHYPLTRGNLLEQEIESESNISQANGVGVRGTRYTSNNAVNWQDKSGWYIDFDGTYIGERVISQALVSGLNVYFVTFKPSLNECQGGGYSWLMALNRANGGPPLLQPFDSNGDNKITSADFDSSKGVTSGIELDGVSVGLKSIARCGQNLCVYAQVKPEISQDGLFSGRWRWKQLR